MKVLKRAEQKNVVVNNQFYARSEIIEMLENNIVWFFVENPLRASHDPREYEENGEIRINLNCGDELKVEYNDEYGCYDTVLLKSNGTKIHVIV